MQAHNPTYCCSVMANWIANSVVAVNPVEGTAHMNVLYTPTPGEADDPEPDVERIQLNHCPNCGDVIIVYSEAQPSPEYTRATTTGGACDDFSCRFCDVANLVCQFAYRAEAGCFSTDAAVKIAYSNLRTNVNKGWQDFVTE